MRRVLVMVGVSVAALGLVANPASSETSTYTYDAHGRLVKVSVTPTAGNASNTQICYDAAGNRTRYTTSANPQAPCTTNSAPVSLPNFSINDTTGSEGASIIFTVTKNGPANVAYSLNYATANGSATTYDYVAKSGILNFAANETTKTISISLKSDTLIEDDEYFYINLSAPTGGATISDGQGVGTIYDDGMGGQPMCGGVPC